jgi:hypothetical protein
MLLIRKWWVRGARGRLPPGTKFFTMVGQLTGTYFKLYHRYLTVPTDWKLSLLIVALRVQTMYVWCPPANVFCDDQWLARNASIPELMLMNMHNAINYHLVWEAAAAKDEETNKANLMKQGFKRTERNVGINMLAHHVVARWDKICQGDFMFTSHGDLMERMFVHYELGFY